MFGLLLDVGKFLSSESISPVQMLTEPLGETYYYGIAICFDKSGNYNGVRLRTGNTNVLFKNPHSSTPHSYTFVLRLSEKLDNVYRRLKNNAEKIGQTIHEGDNLSLINACLLEATNKKETIIADISKILPGDIGKEKRAYIYWAKYEDSQILGFYEFPEVQQFLVKSNMLKYGTKKISSKILNMKASDAVCSICGQKKDEVYGNFTEIQCYNLDKTGLVTGGFNYSNAVHNFPICSDCILYILSGRNYVKTNLSFKLANKYSYWLLPKATNPEIYKIVLESLNKSKSRQSLGKDLETITGSELEFMDLIAENPDTNLNLLTLNLIFYKEKNAEWRIRSEIREVLPSRISRLWKAKKEVQKRIDNDIGMSNKKQNKDYHFTLNKIEPFCGIQGKQSEKKFLTYIEAIFKERNLTEKVIFKDLTGGIISAQKNDLKNNTKYAPFTVRDAWATYLFLTEIGTLSKEGGTEMPETKSDNVYDEFMNANHAFFSNAYRRTAFLTGCYVNSVLYIQQSKRNSQPFEKKFIGKILNKIILKSLYTQGETKLRQYDSLGIVHQLTPSLAYSWIICGDKWELSDDETTFAFTLGLTLGSKLAAKKSKDSEVMK